MFDGENNAVPVGDPPAARRLSSSTSPRCTTPRPLPALIGVCGAWLQAMIAHEDRQTLLVIDEAWAGVERCGGGPFLEVVLEAVPCRGTGQCGRCATGRAI